MHAPEEAKGDIHETDDEEEEEEEEEEEKEEEEEEKEEDEKEEEEEEEGEAVEGRREEISKPLQFFARAALREEFYRFSPTPFVANNDSRLVRLSGP
uniref:Uncharacterized protein n=1 Tax=Toxoplasma gondii COUG TaxID=1074873 RepID=A0A2G8XQL2_TOXGO|nr:hypothetical protein TGCOUG_278005 [Toxoplasma gondii COUG]